MDKLLKSISYIFHPLVMPLFAIWFYFEISPRFVPEDIVQAKLISMFILAILLPILTYFLLKTLGKVNSIHLETSKERIYPLMLYCIIIIIVLQRIITPSQVIEVYFFLIGLLISNMTCLLMAIMNFKISLHMMAACGVFMFFVALSIHFSININGTLSLMAIMIGAIATSRLHLKAHNVKELIIGTFIGMIPQLVLVNYWL